MLLDFIMKPYFVLQQMKCFFLYYLLNLLRNYETDNKFLMISGGSVGRYGKDSISSKFVITFSQGSWNVNLICLCTFLFINGYDVQVS